jgi:hypothetical protein
MHLVIGIIIIAGLGVGGWQFLKWRESEQFNSGVCNCGGHFKAFEKKVQASLSGTRGYQCDGCRKTVWLAYATDVDYEYTESEISKLKKETENT